MLQCRLAAARPRLFGTPLACRHDQPQGRDAAELLSGDLTRLAPPVNALFFGLVGASLKLSGARRGEGRLGR